MADDEPVDNTKVFHQRAQLDTTGLGGPDAQRLDKAYRLPTVRSGIYREALDEKQPRDAEIVKAEKERQEATQASEDKE